MNLPVKGFCTACFNGVYPIDVACKQSSKLLDYEEDDGGCGGCGVHI